MGFSTQMRLQCSVGKTCLFGYKYSNTAIDTGTSPNHEISFKGNE